MSSASDKSDVANMRMLIASGDCVGYKSGLIANFLS